MMCRCRSGKELPLAKIMLKMRFRDCGSACFCCWTVKEFAVFILRTKVVALDLNIIDPQLAARHTFPNLEQLSFANRKELSPQSVKQVQRLLVRLYIVYGSRDPFHVFASLQLTTSATRNCVWTSKAVLAFKTRPYKQLLQLM
jgi:hypothetical protein